MLCSKASLLAPNLASRQGRVKEAGLLNQAGAAGTQTHTAGRPGCVRVGHRAQAPFCIMGNDERKAARPQTYKQPRRSAPTSAPTTDHTITTTLAELAFTTTRLNIDHIDDEPTAPLYHHTQARRDRITNHHNACLDIWTSTIPTSKPASASHAYQINVAYHTLHTMARLEFVTSPTERDRQEATRDRKDKAPRA